MIEPHTMLAARFHGPGDIRIEEIPVPTPGEDQALVRVRWAGLCGSDLEEYRDGPIVTRPPVVLGHEIVGTIAVAAANGSGPAVGTDVIVDVVTGCGRCFWCERHEEGQCPNLNVTGLDLDGGLAEYVIGRANRLLPVPPELNLRHAALAEPTAVAVRAVRKLGNVTGRSAVIIGGGTIGLLVGQVLSHAGATPVVVVEPVQSRREIAHRLDLTSEWADSPENRAAALAASMPPRGVDFVVECSGANGAMREAVHLLRRGGEAILLSVRPDDQQLDLTDIVLGEKTLRGSAAHMWDEDVAPALALLASGALDVEPLISHEVPLADARTAFELLADSTSGALKILVDTGSPRRINTK